ncbi:MAG TPA: methyltransferase domain-containing protein [Thermoanaerobaculia bacterium]|nr:methyltransferase domain-containing protein [Thermoanaerobaculia bacterium]
MSSDPVYIHGTSPEGQRRLSLMNDVLLNPPSLREMALAGDESIIDFGSGLGQFTRAMARAVPHGRVLGLERDPEQIAGARRLAQEEAGTPNVDFRQADALDPQLSSGEWGTFDVAHSRFVLEHVPDPLRVVQNMVRAVRPGGRIVLADDDHEIMRLSPEPPGFHDFWRAYIRSYEYNRTDPIVGRRLVALLHEAGATPRRNTFIFFGGCVGMPYFDVLAANLLGVVTTARQLILENHLLDERAFDEAVTALQAWSNRPDAAIWYAMNWAEGVRS